MVKSKQPDVDELETVLDALKNSMKRKQNTLQKHLDQDFTQKLNVIRTEMEKHVHRLEQSQQKVFASFESQFHGLFEKQTQQMMAIQQLFHTWQQEQEKLLKSWEHQMVQVEKEFSKGKEEGDLFMKQVVKQQPAKFQSFFNQ